MYRFVGSLQDRTVALTVHPKGELQYDVHGSLEDVSAVQWLGIRHQLGFSCTSTGDPWACPGRGRSRAGDRDYTPGCPLLTLFAELLRTIEPRGGRFHIRGTTVYRAKDGKPFARILLTQE